MSDSPQTVAAWQKEAIKHAGMMFAAAGVSLFDPLAGGAVAAAEKDLAISRPSTGADPLEGRPEFKNIVLIAGPGYSDQRGGIQAWDKSFIDKSAEDMRATGAKVTVVGDGERDIAPDEVKSALSAQKGNTNVVVLTHGETKGEAALAQNDPLYLVYEKGKADYPAQELFKMMNETSNGELRDCTMTACFGNAGMKQAQELLPKGSAFVSLIPENGEQNLKNTQQLFEALPGSPALKESVGADRMMNLYFLAAPQGNTPSIAIAGGESYNWEKINRMHDLRRYYNDDFSTGFNADDKKRIEQRLGNYLPPGELEKTLNADFQMQESLVQRGLIFNADRTNPYPEPLKVDPPAQTPNAPQQGLERIR